jgi:tetratricopeptide (TPR) repeat protein
MITVRNLAIGISLLIFALALTARSLAAQEDLGTGRISGKVVDEAGAPIAEARIVAASLQSSTKLTGTTDDKGNFAIAGFGTGPWRIAASKPGYAVASIDMQVRQLVRNPPVNLILKKESGTAAPVLDQTVRKDFDRANRLAVEGHVAEAAALYEGLLSQHPEIYQIHLNAALCELKLEDQDKAKSHFQATLDLLLKDGGSYEKDAAAAGKALIGLGGVAMRSGQLEEAMGHFRRALELAPDDEIVAYNVAEILFSAQDVDGAISYYEQALRIKKDWSKPLFKLGLAHLNKGNYDRALEYLNRFLEVDPENSQVPEVRRMIEAIQKIKKQASL